MAATPFQQNLVEPESDRAYLSRRSCMRWAEQKRISGHLNSIGRARSTSFLPLFFWRVMAKGLEESLLMSSTSLTLERLPRFSPTDPPSILS